MKYAQLTEGIIKVPPTLFNAFAQYLGTVMVSFANLGVQSLQYSDDHNDIKDVAELKKFISMIQSKSKAKIVNMADIDQLIDTVINVNYDTKQAFSELPKNLQKDKVLESLQNIKLQLVITETTGQPGLNGSFDGKSRHDVYKIEIKLQMSDSRPTLMSRGGLSMFNTLYHELQHLIQQIAINNTQDNSPQLKKHRDYYNYDDDYFSSPVEYSTQTGDLAHEALDILRDLKNEGSLSDSKSDNIKKVVMMAHEAQPMFLDSLRRKGMEKEFKRSIRDIYTKVTQNYDEVIGYEESEDYDSTEHEVDADVNYLESIARKLKQRGFDIATGADYISIHQLIPRFNMFVQVVEQGFFVKWIYEDNTIESLVDKDTIDRVLKSIGPDNNADNRSFMQYVKSNDLRS